MGYMTAAQRIQKIHRFSESRQMKCAPAMQAYSADSLHDRPLAESTTYNHDFERHQPAGEAVSRPSVSRHGYALSGDQDAFYATNNGKQQVQGSNHEHSAGQGSSHKWRPWHRQPAANDQEIYSATPAEQVFIQQIHNGSSQQYASTYCQYQPFQQYAWEGYTYQHPWLTQQWQTVNGVPPPPPPPGEDRNAHTWDLSARQRTVQPKTFSSPSGNLNPYLHVNKQSRLGQFVSKTKAHLLKSKKDDVPPPPPPPLEEGEIEDDVPPPPPPPFFEEDIPSPPPPPTEPAATRKLNATAPTFRNRQQNLSVMRDAQLDHRMDVDYQSRLGRNYSNQTFYPPNENGLHERPWPPPSFFEDSTPPPPPGDTSQSRPSAKPRKRGAKTVSKRSTSETQDSPDSVASQLSTVSLGSRRWQPDKIPHQHVLPRPEPSLLYSKQANCLPKIMDQPRPLLVVLDLNGTLIHRTGRGPLAFIERPRVNEFLHYLFSNHHVMVWSSAMPQKVEKTCKQLLSKDQQNRLIACWARDKLRIPAQAYYEKVQVYKQLSWILKDKTIQAANPDPVDYWDQTNTVLIDDSMEKAASEPSNLIQIEEFKGTEEQIRSDVLGQVVKYLETLRCQDNVSAYMQSREFKYDAEDAFDWMPIINDMH